MIRPIATIVVPTPGIIVRATSLELHPAQHFACHGVLFQVLPENTGRMFIGSVSMDRLTRLNCYAILPRPTVDQIPSFSAALTIAPNALGLEAFYLDADEGGDGVIISALIL